MSIQMMLLGTGAVATKTYVDDIFSTFVYAGNTSGQSINNGIDLAGEGALTWIKQRNGGAWHQLYDTERGATKALYSNGNDAEATVNAGLTAFNNNGFTLGNHGGVSTNGNDYASWTFRKAPGFFDVVKWDGNNTAGRQIAHNLGCVPGCIIVKSYVDSDPRPWRVYHRGVDATAPEDYALRLDGTDARSDNSAFWNDTAPTSSVFTVGNHASTNTINTSYVAYVFAGGESTAATARSVDFDGNDYLTIPASTDLDAGAGDVTIETWFKLDGTGSYYRIFAKGFGQQLQISSNKFKAWFNDVDEYDGSYSIALSSTTTIQRGQWYHGAVTRSGNTFRLFLNGVEEDSATASFTVATTSYSTLVGSGDYGSISSSFEGLLSNFRYVKGTAVYTSSFRPPTEPLTNITNTKLLCCNNSSVTGSTVTPTTISSSGDPTASTDSPFDDPAAFTFGDSGDQNVIKCGSYVGDESDSNEVFLGFEPQWVMIKNASSGGNSWYMFDAIRGIPMDRYVLLQADKSDEEYDYAGAMINVTPTGFKVVYTSSDVNGNGDTLVYIAIRRPDGYVGKQYGAGEGTSVFAMDMASGTGNVPNYDSNFPVDFALVRQPAASDSWYTQSRMTGTKYLFTNTTASEATLANWVWDSNVGWAYGASNAYLSWMWKRHAGSFDVVTYTGNDVAGRQIPHSLNAVPEMMWIKRRDTTTSWYVYHKGLNGGSSPEDYTILLESNGAEIDSSDSWNDTAPTATHFTLGDNSGTNGTTSGTFLTMLFASVKGVSHCGTFTGNGSTQTITIPDGGFQPRFLIMKCTSHVVDWHVLDTTRGWGSGDDKYLELNSNAAQYTVDMGAPTSTGFTLTQNAGFNGSGRSYIYYAHA